MSFVKLLQKAGVAAQKPIFQQTLVDFKRPGELKNLLIRSDAELGGFSTAHLDITKIPKSEFPLTFPSPLPTSTSTPFSSSSSSNSPSDSHLPSSNLPSEFSVGHFHGVLNLDLPANRPDVVQSGYAMFRTHDQRPTDISSSISSFFGTEPVWVWSSCSHLLLRVKGDRRKYFINIQAESPIPTDIYQHRLFLKTPGQWENVLVPLQDFILTNWGVIQEQRSMNLEAVKTIGIGLVDKQYGPFSLFIDSIHVINSKYINIEDHPEAKSKLPPSERLPGKKIPLE